MWKMRTIVWASIALCSLSLLAAAGFGADPVAELWRSTWGEDAKIILSISRNGDLNDTSITNICVGDKPKLTATIDPPAGGYDSANLGIWKGDSSIASGTSSPLETVYQNALSVEDHTFTAKATIYRDNQMHPRKLTPDSKTLSVVDNGTLTVKDEIYNRSQEDDNIDPPPAAPTAKPLVVGPKSLGPEADQKCKIKLSFTFPVQTWTTDTFPWSLVGMSMSGQFSRGEGGSSQASVDDLAPPATDSIFLGKSGNGVYARRIDIEMPRVNLWVYPAGFEQGAPTEALEEDPGLRIPGDAAAQVLVLKAGIAGFTRKLSWDSEDKVTVKDFEGTTQSSPISLTEADEDPEYTITATDPLESFAAKFTLEVEKNGTKLKDVVKIVSDIVELEFQTPGGTGKIISPYPKDCTPRIGVVTWANGQNQAQEDTIEFKAKITPSQTLDDEEYSWSGKESGIGPTISVTFDTGGTETLSCLSTIRTANITARDVPAPNWNTWSQQPDVGYIKAGIIAELGFYAQTWSADNEAALGGGISNGRANAARHAYWAARIRLHYLDANLAMAATTAYERTNIENGGKHNETVMDLENNAIGANNIGGNDTDAIKAMIIQALDAGEFAILDDLQNANESGLLIPSNKN